MNEQGEDFTDTPDILNYQKNYYSTLYSETINIDDTPISEEIGRNKKKIRQWIYKTRVWNYIFRHTYCFEKDDKL